MLLDRYRWLIEDTEHEGSIFYVELPRTKPEADSRDDIGLVLPKRRPPKTDCGASWDK